jgi:hypothetical protein
MAQAVQAMIAQMMLPRSPQQASNSHSFEVTGKAEFLV